MNTSDWMKCNSTIQLKPITKIGMVGSHDSGTSTILPQYGITPFTIFPKKHRSFMKRWSKTQQLGIRDQCIAGIRYFDFRVVYNHKLKKFYLLHGLYCQLLETALQDITCFLTEHDGEVIIIDINHLYQINSLNNFQSLCLLIEECCSKHLVLNDYNKFIIPLSQLVHIKQRLFVFCLNPFNQKLPLYLFPQDQIDSIWPNKNETRKMLKRLDYNSKVYQNNQKLTIIQAVVTPSIKSIRKSYYTKKYPNSTIKIAEKTNPLVLKWLQTSSAFVNILLIDNVKMNDEIVHFMIRRNNFIEKY
ncbi:glycosylphosphatidylinositol diacylglycerol-lyase, putative [Entamoeba nuttalli P19]|uniref:Glycosylphosphatidylinositol diacylglycerol-lyase, putative n=1 Tax=Entamoeba nuttalli (strain P19) TaxID=1076696 RepID=K2H3Y0_ENTNP|nr:glycosylphosphatidylinositol diacylglycerol-lyase, putative [Entamoeba nuttalli P19]EKE42198.1 glycosylphosphatidylinositol diacylglycerol-lyase, putative [Entamoeba nuttalli P19]|eukprot:XP_008855471.1 glycosylphosphatidylinositol diacylglycerol-lyase, putative [Entamoeba nuttalli P19]